MLLFYVFRLEEWFTISSFRLYQKHLMKLVIEHPFLAPALYMLLYTLITALSFPGALLLSLAGGFLFSQPFCTLYVVISATLGATIIFLAAKTALGVILRKKRGGLYEKIGQGFQKNAANYLLFVRLVPLFPFWMVNLAASFFEVALWTYVWTTFIGIIPGAFVFTQAGRGIFSILDQSEELGVHSILNKEVKLAMLALALFSLMPILLKNWYSSMSKNRG